MPFNQQLETATYVKLTFILPMKKIRTSWILRSDFPSTNILLFILNESCQFDEDNQDAAAF
ncbi:hypothetical protein PMEGAS70_48150 [Priestia megaterium]|uniref:Uncharacterized protein n=1 Tax=Priestia megaterium TaxID=1404 RepID=A0AAX6BED5_PRIMG|nr:hypothetical protein ShirakiTB12_05630 [Priestia megaterium]